MIRHSILIFVAALSLAAEMHPLQRLIEAARANSLELKTLLTQGLPGLKGRDCAAVWGQDFLFAIESKNPATVSIDGQAPLLMQRAADSDYWYKLATLRLGTTHSYAYIASASLGSYEVAGYNPDSYPVGGVPQGRLSPMRTLNRKTYPGLTANYWVYTTHGVDPAKAAPFMVWQDGETIVGNDDLLRLRRQTVSDNPVQKRLIPPMVHILIAPGKVDAVAATDHT